MIPEPIAAIARPCVGESQTNISADSSWQFRQTTANWFACYYFIPEASENSGSLHRGYLNRFELRKLASALSLAGDFILLNRQLTFSSTYVQTLKHSIVGSTKLGQVKACQSLLPGTDLKRDP